MIYDASSRGINAVYIETRTSEGIRHEAFYVLRPCGHWLVLDGLVPIWRLQCRFCIKVAEELAASLSKLMEYTAIVHRTYVWKPPAERWRFDV